MIEIEPRDGWRKLILNRQEKLNAVNPAMLTDLLRAIGAAEADDSTRALLLTGNGRGFCAGQELGPEVTPGANGPPDLETLARTYHHAVVRCSPRRERTRGTRNSIWKRGRRANRAAPPTMPRACSRFRKSAHRCSRDERWTTLHRGRLNG